MTSTRDSASLQRVWLRVAARIGASTDRSRGMVTVLRQDMRSRRLAGGARVVLVNAALLAARGGGPAARLRLVELPACAFCRLPLLPNLGSDCLVLSGELSLEGELLTPWDYHHRPAGSKRISLATLKGARLLVRESRAASGATSATTQRAARCAWEMLPSGIAKRPLGVGGGGRLSLQRMAPGGPLPPHPLNQGEDCLVLEGALFVEDRLLRSGDYLRAAAGTAHVCAASDRGALIFHHADE